MFALYTPFHRVQKNIQAEARNKKLIKILVFYMKQIPAQLPHSPPPPTKVNSLALIIMKTTCDV